MQKKKKKKEQISKNWNSKSTFELEIVRFAGRLVWSFLIGKILNLPRSVGAHPYHKRYVPFILTYTYIAAFHRICQRAINLTPLCFQQSASPHRFNNGTVGSRTLSLRRHSWKAGIPFFASGTWKETIFLRLVGSINPDRSDTRLVMESRLWDNITGHGESETVAIPRLVLATAKYRGEM